MTSENGNAMFNMPVMPAYSGFGNGGFGGMQNVIDGLNAQVNSADRRVAMGEEIDALYNRLNNCPIPATPVYGRTPIFTCGGQNTGCGCGGNAFMN